MIKVFDNEDGNTVFVAHGTIGSWPFYCLQAIGNGDVDTYPIIQDNTGSFDMTMLNMVPSNIVTDTP